MLCLQEWFRQAPVDEDEMYDDYDPPSPLNRCKTCPCCRAVVRSRPIPIFLVKTIATSLSKAKGEAQSPSERTNTLTPGTDDDPWEGLFPYSEDDDMFDSDEGESDEDDDDDDDDEDEDEDEDDSDKSSFGYGTGSDEESSEGPYISAQWEPPARPLLPEDGVVATHLVSMLRRGATKEMIEAYKMSYTHSEGLLAVINDPRYRYDFVFLGWTISLREDDPTGQDYMEWVLEDISERPERWDVSETGPGQLVAKRLIPADDLVDYDTECDTD